MSLRLLAALAGISFYCWMGSTTRGAEEDAPAEKAAAEAADTKPADEKPGEPKPEDSKPKEAKPADAAEESPPAAEKPAEPPTEPTKEKPEKAAAPDAAPADLKAAQEKFDSVVTQWKEGLKELALLQESYRKANEAEQKKMAAEFNAKRQQLAEEVKPQLVTAAKQLYKLEGKENEDLQNFLRMVLMEKFEQDRWDELHELTHMLKESGIDEPQLDLFDAIAAFGINRFDEAQENIEKAAEAGLLQLPEDPSSEHQLMSRRREIGTQIRGVAAAYKEFWKEEQELRAAEAKADDLPRVKLETSQGDIVIELFENEAPNTVANFISLVEKGYYDGLIFHRVLPSFMAQGGCPDGTGGGGPGYRIPCECYKDLIRKHFTGSLSMAKTAQRDTGGSQFFLTFRPTPHLNGAHTVFGRVIEGLDVLPDLQRIDPSARTSQPDPDKILKATVIRKRDHEYVPKTLP